MFVIPAFVDKKIEIYNGKSFISLKILPEMLNLRLGELAPTRRIGVKHSGKADATSNPKAEGGKKE